MSNIQQSRNARLSLPILAIAAAALLGACGRPADDTASGEGRTDRDAAVTDTGKSIGQVGAEVKQEAREAGQAVADTTKDMAITTEINTLLARDNQLSAIKIDVDTNAGQVMLQGSAPSDEARAHAADLARSVAGVINVDNKLQVQPRN